MRDAPGTRVMTLMCAILMAMVATMLMGATKGDPLPKARNGAVAVATASATLIPTAGMIGRNSIAIFNNGPNTIWCGWDSTVTNLTGFPVAPQAALNVDVVQDNSGTPDLYCRADTALQVSPANTRYMEVK